MFPTFIDESSRQGTSQYGIKEVLLISVDAPGANPDVIAKLQFFKSMHNVRTVFRAVYSVTLVVMAADGLSEKQKINHQQ